jgi:hypothetical protein
VDNYVYLKPNDWKSSSTAVLAEISLPKLAPLIAYPRWESRLVLITQHMAEFTPIGVLALLLALCTRIAQARNEDE